MKNFFGGIAWGQNIFAALLAVLGMIVFFHYTDKAPDLVYQTFPPAQFTTQETQISIYNARIENVGDKEAEDVLVRFELPPTAVIQELKIEPSLPNIPSSVAATESSHIRDVLFPILNHGESASFSVLADKGEAVPIQIAIRGKGVIGHTDQSSDSAFRLLLLNSLAIAVAAVVLIFKLWTTISYDLGDMVRSLKRVSDTELRIARTRDKLPSEQIVANLRTKRYRLYYNPKVPGLAKTKPMRFGDNGEIIEGHNNNESTWRIQNDQLNRPGFSGGFLS